jgi:hypothetical protein
MDAAAAQALRRRAFAWRATAERLRSIRDAAWPGWILSHLARSTSLPYVGPEYERQRAYLVRILARRGAASAGGTSSEQGDDAGAAS